MSLMVTDYAFITNPINHHVVSQQSEEWIFVCITGIPYWYLQTYKTVQHEQSYSISNSLHTCS